MKKIIFILLIMIIPISGMAFDLTNSIKNNVKTWDFQDTVLQSTFLFFTTIDWLQSRSSLNLKELNPIFRNNYPSKLQFDLMISFGMLLHTGISFLLPPVIKIKNKKFYPRIFWQSIWIGIEANASFRNHMIGIKIKF